MSAPSQAFLPAAGRCARRAALLAFGALLSTGCAPRSYVALLDNLDGSAGRVVVSTSAGTRVLEEAGTGVGIGAGEAPPGEPFTLSARRLRSDFGSALAAQPMPPERFLLYFKLDTTELTEASRRLVPEILRALAERPAPDLSIAGHTDRAGDDAYNVELALRRALSVRDLVVAEGVDPAMIEVATHGEHNPLIATADGVFEPRNRRVEVTVR